MFAARPEDLADRETILALSGLALLEGIRDRRIAEPPMGRTLGFRVTGVERGRVAVTGAAAFEHANPLGAVHGGWYGAVLDSCMTLAVHSTLEAGKICTTLEYKVNVVRNLAIDTEVEAVGRVAHAGRSTGVATGELRGLADGRLYATGSTTCLVMPG